LHRLKSSKDFEGKEGTDTLYPLSRYNNGKIDSKKGK